MVCTYVKMQTGCRCEVGRGEPTESLCKVPVEGWNPRGWRSRKAQVCGVPTSLENLGDFKRPVPLSGLDLGKGFPTIAPYPLIMNPVSMFQPPFTI